MFSGILNIERRFLLLILFYFLIQLKYLWIFYRNYRYLFAIYKNRFRYQNYCDNTGWSGGFSVLAHGYFDLREAKFVIKLPVGYSIQWAYQVGGLIEEFAELDNDLLDGKGVVLFSFSWGFYNSFSFYPKLGFFNSWMAILLLWDKITQYHWIREMTDTLVRIASTTK